MVRITNASYVHLDGILRLQEKNLKINLTDLEISSQGFVSIRHNVELLSRMNTPYPHTIALDGSRVIGYALTMLPELRQEIPELELMFKELAALDNFVVMGQVCIDKDYRSKGLFRSMFAFMKDKFRGEVDCIITEVAQENKRSLDAHFAIGFVEYCIRHPWVVLLLEIDK